MPSDSSTISSAQRRITDAATRAPGPNAISLSALPAELQYHILDLLDEDSLARMGSTNRFWRQTTEPYVYPAHIGPQQAVRQARRHLLGRLWHTPRDASPWTTGRCDADGMTVLMHAATQGDTALLRCLMRHGNGHIHQTDAAGLRAVDWAYLTGHFGAFSGAALQVPRAQRVGPERDTRVTLHDAIAAGHHYLVATLLAPHYTRLSPTLPNVRREGYHPTQRLTCGLSGVDCAEQHAPQHRPLDQALTRQGSLCRI